MLAALLGVLRGIAAELRKKGLTALFCSFYNGITNRDEEVHSNGRALREIGSHQIQRLSIAFEDDDRRLLGAPFFVSRAPPVYWRRFFLPAY